jgi:hypothetical protein
MHRISVGLLLVSLLNLAGSTRLSTTIQIQHRQVLRDVEINGELMSGAAWRLSQVYGVVIGYESGSRGPERRNFSVQLKSVSIEEAMDAIMRKDSRFAWRINPNGTITVFNKEMRPTLSDVLVSNFQADELYRQEISQRLDEIPEIRRWLEDNRCQRTQWITGKEWRNDKKRVSLSMKQKTLREILDEVAVHSETFYWSINVWEESDGCHISINI